MYFLVNSSRYSIEWMQAEGGFAGCGRAPIVTEKTEARIYRLATTHATGNIQGEFL